MTTGEHAVLVTFGLGGDEFVGTADQRRSVIDVEHRIEAAVVEAGVGWHDGHGFGMGEASLFTYGADADALWRVMEPLVRAVPIRPARAVLRYGDVDDPDVVERVIEL